jgi:hypothetical protein
MASELEREARELTEEAKRLNLEAGRNSLARGKIYRRVIDAKMWTQVGYDTFSEWLKAVGEDSRSWAYSLAELYAEVEATVPAEALPNLTAANANDLTKLPENKRSDPTILAAAQEMSNPKFRKVLNKFQPGLALEEKEFKSFKMGDAARSVVMESVKIAIDESGGEIKTEGAAIEFICNEWKQQRDGEAGNQRSAVQSWVRTVEAIINELLPTLKFPDAKQWARNVIACERVRNAFGFAKGDAAEVKPKRTPKPPPAEAERAAVTNRIQ